MSRTRSWFAWPLTGSAVTATLLKLPKPGPEINHLRAPRWTFHVKTERHSGDNSVTIPVKLDTPSSSACLGGSSRRKYGRSAEKFRDNPSPFIRLASVLSKDCVVVVP